jgi:DNA-directed RNA polymerase III subunit RPC3
MIQQHLVYHYTSYDDGVTYYEANMQSAYYLVRSGKILEFVEERLGKYAATVLSTVMYLGHAQVSYLETLPELKSEAVKANGVSEEHAGYGEDEEQPNGLNGEHTHEQPELLHPTLKALAAHGYIIRVREAQFQSHADNILDAERVIRSKPEIKALKGKRLEEAVIEKTLELLKERTDGDLTRGLIVHGVPRGAKRKHSSRRADQPNKKSRIDLASVDEDDEQDEDEDEEEENEWSDDEMGYDTTPMEVSASNDMP